jgi:2',3'-cyclic-nucleotide 2'-phosphodiesterase (5'-nucleotidase family)
VYSRRRFLRLLGGGGALLAAWPRRALADQEELVTVSVLHTTDLHGHITPTRMYPDAAGVVVEDVGGLARCATQIRAWRKENPHHLLLDVGDIYQGTQVSHASRGRLMMKLLNQLGYDGWVIGNHEFDWGQGPFREAVAASAGAVLGSNAKVDGVYANMLKEGSHPLAKIRPYLVKEVAGFRIGVIGSITPGLPDWLPPGLLGGFSAAPPVRSLHYAMSRLQREGADAVVVAAHMGLKGPGAPDDFANRINSIAMEVDGVDCILGGHTHREFGEHMLNKVPYTQAGYHGIWCGRADLVFAKANRKLVAVRCQTRLMDSAVRQDPAVLSASAAERKASAVELARVIGVLEVDLPEVSAPGRPAASLRLITRAMRHALARRKVPVDGVLHGCFLESTIKAGPKTIGDAWEIVPFENRLCTAGFTRDELVAILDETFNAKRSTHNLDGFEVRVEKVRRTWQVKDVRLAGGRPLEPGRRYRVALNSFDAQSGGRRFPNLQRFAAAREAGLSYLDIESREALIEWFTEKGQIGAADLGLD